MAIIAYGFLMHLAQITAIGPQNILVLTSGMKRKNLIVPLICIALDLGMMAIMMLEFIKILSQSYILLQIIRLCGFAFLAKCSYTAFQKFLRHSPQVMDGSSAIHEKIAKNAILVSILNPGAWLDTIAISTVSLEYSGVEVLYFYLGSALASSLWFFGVGILSHTFAKFLKSPIAWRYINLATGAIMSFMAVKLLI